MTDRPLWRCYLESAALLRDLERAANFAGSSTILAAKLLAVVQGHVPTLRSAIEAVERSEAAGPLPAAEG